MKRLFCFFEEFSGKIVLPEYILTEVISVLLRILQKPDADAFLQYVQSDEDIEVIYSSPEFVANLSSSAKRYPVAKDMEEVVTEIREKMKGEDREEIEQLVTEAITAVRAEKA